MSTDRDRESIIKRMLYMYMPQIDSIFSIHKLIIEESPSAPFRFSLSISADYFTCVVKIKSTGLFARQLNYVPTLRVVLATRRCLTVRKAKDHYRESHAR